MSPELQSYFETLLDLFTHPGWEVVKQDMEEAKELYKLESCKTVEDFWEAKHKSDTYDRFLRYEDIIKQTYDEYGDNAST